MGAFTVFGVSRAVCRKTAERKFPPKSKETVTDWGIRVRAEADGIFDSTEKRVKIAPEFDAPQFCRDWIATSPGEVRETKIMYRGEKIDKHGAVVMRLGAPVLTWLEFDEMLPWPRPFGEVYAHQAA